MKLSVSISFFLFFLISNIFVSWFGVVVVVAFSLMSEGKALLSIANSFSHVGGSMVYPPDFIKLSWNNLSTSNTPCNWTGISCNTKRTHVVSLHLGGSSIYGQLSPQIGQLRYLKSLDLGTNSFSGSIPIELWNCSHLQYLDLSMNFNFSGELPEGGLRNLHRLKSFSVAMNQFSGKIPESLFQISSLESVHLEWNNFTGSIPLNIGNATNLKELRMGDNPLHGNVPTSIANCTKLETLILGKNGLSGEIPLGVWRIPTLDYIYVSYNNLSGELPLEMTYALHHLTYMFLNNNQFSGLIPEELGINITNLILVDFNDNNFSGKIPPNLCFGNHLIQMELNRNQFSGSIPASYIEQCYSLSWLSLQGNKLTHHSFPLHLEKNISLITYLDISRNNIHGEFRSSICNMSSLETLDLSENRMNGTLPHCLGDLNQLQTLKLRNNHFSGIIPPNFTINHLYQVDLNGNSFEGKIPRSSTHRPSSLVYLDVGNNQLNDTFPNFLENVSTLEILVIRSNKLHGPLRHYLTDHLAFQNLKILDISSNYFTGNLPVEFNLGLDSMRHYRVQYTDPPLNYPDTSSVVIHKGKEMRLNRTFLEDFRAIDMSNNTFQGTIPKSIGDLLNLTMLNLSNNNFNGRIPSSLGNLIELESLDLSQNKLFGEIPRHLTDMHSLAFLNLSGNNLTGRIPDGGQFSTFTNDSFSGNSRLCGLQMSRKCGEDSNNKSRPDPVEENESIKDSYNPWNFGWEPVVIGYGCGIVIGLVIQYFLFTKAFLYRWFG